MPASDRQSGFHHSFFEPTFCFLPGPALYRFRRSSLIGIGPPCFNCCFRVSSSTSVTLLLYLSVTLNHLSTLVLSANPFLEYPFFLGHQRTVSTVASKVIPERSDPCGLYKSTYSVSYDTCLSLRTFLLLFTVIPYGHSLRTASVQNI